MLFVLTKKAVLSGPRSILSKGPNVLTLVASKLQRRGAIELRALDLSKMAVGLRGAQIVDSMAGTKFHAIADILIKRLWNIFYRN